MTKQIITSLLLAAVTVLPACNSAPKQVDSPTAIDRTASNVTNKTTQKSAPITQKPVAYINAQPVSAASLMPSMYEVAGGEALANVVIDLGIKEDLALKRIKVTPAMIEAEKQLILDNLSPDPDEAVRMLNRLRDQRGLGDSNFQALLRRNAALRAIVANDVVLSAPLLKQEYQLRFGPRYQPRIITAPDLRTLKQLHARIEKGEDFAELAGNNSTDISARQGGLLSPISPADTNYPLVVRDQLRKMKPGEISDAISIDNGFALLKLERITPASELKYEQVEDQLREALKLRIEATLMRQKAAEYIASSKVTVLQPNLLQSWMRKKLEYTQPE